MRRSPRTLWCPVGWLIALVLLVPGCTPADPPAPTPSPGADAVAEQLTRALLDGSIEALPVTGDAARARIDYTHTMSAMDGLLPQSVEYGALTYDEDATGAVTELAQTWRLGDGEWKYTSTARLEYVDGRWAVDWTPQIVHPALTAETRLFNERTTARRAPILGAGGTAIVEERPVYRVGIDKSRIGEDAFETSARQLAAIVQIDPDQYAQQVLASGPQAFVVAITLREGQVPPEVETVPGVNALPSTLPLAPSSTFARALLGSAGEATAEIVEESAGAVQPGDIVGLSGLQRIHDEQLRGSPGHTITTIVRNDEQLAELSGTTPTPTDRTPESPPASPEPSGTPTPTPSGAGQLLFSVAPVDGTALQLTMDVDLQRRAEEVLSGYPTLVMVVVLDRGTGGILAAAASPSAGGQTFPTTGHYPPGSTMKVVTALALLRRGLTPDSLLDCSPTAEINGRVFNNYPGYPASATGMITMRTALAQSCNTAFMNASRDLGPDELASAAASLGIGVDYDSGFDAFYGQVGTLDDPVLRAASTIGQGNVLASPMAMAGEAASVGAGRTVVPYLVESHKPAPSGAPLTEAEAAQLADMMGAVVGGGTLSPLAGVLEGGKSGTAEYTNDDPPRTHAWTVGYVGRYAICAMDYEQQNGQIPQDVIRAMVS